MILAGFSLRCGSNPFLPWRFVYCWLRSTVLGATQVFSRGQFRESADGASMVNRGSGTDFGSHFASVGDDFCSFRNLKNGSRRRLLLLSVEAHIPPVVEWYVVSFSFFLFVLREVVGISA